MPDIIQQIRDAYTENPAKAIKLLPELFKQYDEGLIPVLPCKVGDTVWKNECGCLKEYNIADIYVCEYFVRYECYQGLKFCTDEIGKTVFLTRESARQH